MNAAANDFLQKVAVIIPTHNRHHYLHRILKYFSSSGIEVYVADSSKQPFAAANEYNAHYFHLPELSYFQKMQRVAGKTTTPYICLCADDDFTVPSAMAECIKFLEENPAYFSAQGKTIFYGTKKNRDVNWWPCHLFIFGFNFAGRKELTERVNDFADDSALKRIDALWKHYVYLYYSVHRRETILDSFNLSAGFDFDIYAASMEFFFNNIAIANGKHKILPHLFQVREFSQSSGTFSLPGLRTANSVEEMYETYHAYFAPLVNHVLQKEKVDVKEAKEKVISPFMKWINTVPEHLSSPVKHPHVKKILSHIPFIGSVKKKYSDLVYKKYAPLNYYLTNISTWKTRGKKGFPLSDNVARHEWKKIKELIKQYPCTPV
jgi:glycosyltransferase domain-containing protein